MAFCSLAKTSRKPKKKKKKSDPWARSGERPGWGHGSESFWFFLFFLVFPWFFAVWPKPQENQKKQKVQTHGQGLGRGLAGDMGLIVFSIVFLHVFHVKMLSSQYFSKNARFYNLHTCAPHEYPF